MVSAHLALSVSARSSHGLAFALHPRHRRERITKNGSLAWPDGSQLTEVWPIAFPRAAWEHAVAEAQVEDFTFHDCRHHFASWFMMRGGKLQALQAILGHRSLAMTTRYAHLSPDHIRGEMLKTERRGHPGTKCWNQRGEGGTGRLASGRLCGGTPG